MARPSNGKTLTLPILLALQKLPHEIRKLLLPPGPIVVHILAPEINPCRHSKPFKLLLQNPCVLFRFILPCALSAANNNPSAAELLHQRMILRHLRQVIHRRIIINIHIIIIREEISCMEQTAQRKASAEKVRSSQIEIHAMIAAHAHPCKHHSAFIGNAVRFAVNLMQARQKFLTEITKPLLMPENSAMLVTPCRAPRFLIHTATQNSCSCPFSSLSATVFTMPLSSKS